MVIIKIGLTFSGFVTAFKYSADSALPHCPGQTDCLHHITIAHCSPRGGTVSLLHLSYLSAWVVVSYVIAWDFFGRNDAKAETPVLWPPHAKSWLIGKDSDAGRDWGQEEKGTTEDEMAGWHHGLDGRESEWTLGDGDGQAALACCDSWGRKESDTTERLNWIEFAFSWWQMNLNFLASHTSFFLARCLF